MSIRETVKKTENVLCLMKLYVDLCAFAGFTDKGDLRIVDGCDMFDDRKPETGSAGLF